VNWLILAGFMVAFLDAAWTVLTRKEPRGAAK
jgi:hypothetical protein